MSGATARTSAETDRREAGPGGRCRGGSGGAGRLVFRLVRAVAQRVTQASVTTGGEVIGAIDEPGLLVLVGVTHDDTPETARKLAAKLWGLRVLDGEKSCSDAGAPLLVVSQFTLYAEVAKGRRPTWQRAAPGPVAEPLVAAVVARAARARRPGRDRPVRRRHEGGAGERRAGHDHP